MIEFFGAAAVAYAGTGAFVAWMSWREEMVQRVVRCGERHAHPGDMVTVAVIAVAWPWFVISSLKAR